MGLLAQFEGRTLELLGKDYILNKPIFLFFFKKNWKESDRFQLLLLEEEDYLVFEVVSSWLKGKGRTCYRRDTGIPSLRPSKKTETKRSTRRNGSPSDVSRWMEAHLDPGITTLFSLSYQSLELSWYHISIPGRRESIGALVGGGLLLRLY